MSEPYNPDEAAVRNLLWGFRLLDETFAEIRQERELIVKLEQDRKAIERAERDAQLEADPEYKPWLDSL